MLLDNGKHVTQSCVVHRTPVRRQIGFSPGPVWQLELIKPGAFFNGAELLGIHLLRSGRFVSHSSTIIGSAQKESGPSASPCSQRKARNCVRKNAGVSKLRTAASTLAASVATIRNHPWESECC